MLLEMEHLLEGINDPYIFKAVFLAGGPGSGKSFIGGHMFAGLGVKFSNSDDLLTFLGGQKVGWDRKELEGFLDFRVLDPSKMHIRERAKVLTRAQRQAWINGMLGLVIDGTARNYGEIADTSAGLEKLGYDTSMVFVNTSLEVAKERNERRARKVPGNVVVRSWAEVQRNLDRFRSLFSGNFLQIDNSQSLDKAESDRLGTELRRAAMKLLGRPLANPRGQAIIQILRQTGGKTLSDLP